MCVEERRGCVGRPEQTRAEKTRRVALGTPKIKKRAQIRNPCLGSSLCRLSAGPTADPDSTPFPPFALLLSPSRLGQFSVSPYESICVTEETDECAPNLHLPLLRRLSNRGHSVRLSAAKPLQPSTHPSHHPSTQPPAPAQAYVHTFPGEHASSVALWLDRMLKRYQLPSLRAPGNCRLTLPFALPHPSTVSSSPNSRQTCPSLSPSSLPSAAPLPVWAPWFVASKPRPVVCSRRVELCTTLGPGSLTDLALAVGSSFCRSSPTLSSSPAPETPSRSARRPSSRRPSRLTMERRPRRTPTPRPRVSSRSRRALWRQRRTLCPSSRRHSQRPWCVKQTPLVFQSQMRMDPG